MGRKRAVQRETKNLEDLVAVDAAFEKSEGTHLINWGSSLLCNAGTVNGV